MRLGTDELGLPILDAHCFGQHKFVLSVAPELVERDRYQRVAQHAFRDRQSNSAFLCVIQHSIRRQCERHRAVDAHPGRESGRRPFLREQCLEGRRD